MWLLLVAMETTQSLDVKIGRSSVAVLFAPVFRSCPFGKRVIQTSGILVRCMQGELSH